jgi:hypothetical protein
MIVASTMSDWEKHHAEHEARVAWLKAHLRKSEHGMESEYRVEVGEAILFRMFRSPLNRNLWVLVAHKPIENDVLRRIGFKFEVEGERDRDRFETRERVLSWIAIRWDYLVDSEMKQA